MLVPASKMCSMKLLFLAPAATLLAMSGCRSGSDLMPLEVGRSWTYDVKAPQSFGRYITAFKVSRRLSVANSTGVEVTSELGASRLAWVGGGLFAERLASAQFRPPLPLLFEAEETHERPWNGRVEFVESASPTWKDFVLDHGLAKATQSQKADDELTYGGKKIHCVKSTVHLKTTAHDIELLTWFSAGLGIVQQEQRTDGKLLVQLKLLEPQGS